MMTNISNGAADLRQERIQAFAFVTAAAVSVLLGAGFTFFEYAGSGRFFEIELDSRINPNESPAASLARLPGIGIALSKRIVSYREKWIKQYGAAAFQTGSDMEKVKGIGPKTVQNISPWLKFE
ncbi:MAG: ComEA family DNA-binding protein [Planctomycetota bacterium]|jgi:DNA uptake protein ComE-like DNA-binding protein